MREERRQRPLYYLTLDDIIGLYADLFGCSDREAADQVRDRGLLEAALMRPANYAAYQGADLALQAAVLAHGIAETQPFVEGNKRAALVALATFLLLNGHNLTASQDERMAWMIALSRDWPVEDFAAAIRRALIADSPDPER